MGNSIPTNAKLEVLSEAADCEKTVSVQIGDTQYFIKVDTPIGVAQKALSQKAKKAGVLRMAKTPGTDIADTKAKICKDDSFVFYPTGPLDSVMSCVTCA